MTTLNFAELYPPDGAEVVRMATRTFAELYPRPGREAVRMAALNFLNFTSAVGEMKAANDAPELPELYPSVDSGRLAKARGAGG